VDAEQVLPRRYETLARALEAARMGYWTWDVETGKVSWSENLEALHGLAKGEFGGTFEAFLDLVHPEDRPRVLEALERSGRGEGDYEIEFRVPWKDGTVHWINGRGHAERRDGKVVRMIGFGIDVTDRRATLLARSRLAAIVESSEDAIIAIDLRGRIESWNAAAERLFGWKAEEAVGEPIQMLLPPSRSDDFFAEVERVSRGERIAHYETLRRRRDGTVLEVALSVSPLRDPSGLIVGASKILRDITAEKAAARERERTRELFVASLGHDLRNPLQTIAASAYSLGRQLPETAEKTVGRIQSSALRMGRMIDQLLDFTRARLGGGIVVRPEPADLGRICASVLEEIEAQHPNRTRLVFDGACEGLWDGDRIAQVVSNLVGNALDHGSPKDPVYVYLRPENGRVQLEVINSGTPIPTDLLPRIFDPFRRGAHEGHGPRQGLGLGLFITQEIVRAHGGSVEIESAGDGTTVRVMLPMGAATPAG
jgi:PAS domain S-box-containing protein